MTDHISDFIAHMRDCGCGPAEPDKITADDKRRRYRVDGDKPKTLNGSYSLCIEPDGFAFGWCMSFKEGVTHAWHTKASRKLSAEDKALHKARLIQAKRDRDAAEALMAAKAAEKASRLWAAAAVDGETEYLTRKRIGLHGARVSGDLVVVPVRSGGELTGLQFIQPDGAKRFLTGTAKNGAYFSIARKADSLAVIVVCEGYATGCSIRAAKSWPVIVAFDAGNLAPVAKVIRAKYPEAEILIAADNDQWTYKPDKVTPWNPGIEKAQQAAAGIGGARVIWPMVPPDDEARRTDWNDIAVTDGLAAVREALTAMPEPINDYDRGPDYDGPVDEVVQDEPLRAIRPLGHNRGVYYFFPRASGQIVDLSASAMGRMQSLYMLAPRGFWERHYGGDKVPDSQITAFASAHLMQACHDVGIFEPESTRGVGAWIDRGRVAVNCGDAVVIDGHRWHPAEFEGEAVYESGPRVVSLDHEPLRNTEAVKLREICRMLQFRHSMFADLLAGWLVVAPVGSALGWRPHIWITGQSGAGKSSVLDGIIKPVLGQIAIRREGGTSEAGVRKSLGASGRPYILDEAETESQAQRINMEKILYLARLASSGGVVENANARYQARSCFCFSAINPKVEQNADAGRITQLELSVDARPDREARYAALLAAINETLTEDYSKALLARTVANMGVLLPNVRTFSIAASAVLGTKRAGDQIGAMLAGAYLLTSLNEITPDAAVKWCAAQDWSWHTSSVGDGDAYRLVTHIMTSRIRYDVNGIGREGSVGELVSAAATRDHVQQDAATSALKALGIKVSDGMIYIANTSPPLRRMLSDTPWSSWRRTLGDYPGSSKTGKAVYFAPGLISHATCVPLAAVTEPDQVDWEIPIEDEAQAYGGLF